MHKFNECTNAMNERTRVICKSNDVDLRGKGTAGDVTTLTVT